MKKVIFDCIALAVMLSVLMCGCGKASTDATDSDSGKTTVADGDFSEYVTVDNYAIEVDTTAADYLSYYNSRLRKDLAYQKTEGTVANGDTANIDFIGYLNGVAFSGGTGSDYDLTIGSGQFIPGFESSLIGAPIGKTTDINVTFPENYGVESLNGQAVVFSVTVNYVEAFYDITDENVQKLGYESAAAYQQEAQDDAVISYAWDVLMESIEINSYPQNEKQQVLDAYFKYYEKYFEANSISMEQLASMNNMTIEQLNRYIEENDVNDTVTCSLVSRALMAAEGRTLTDQDMTRARDEFTKHQGKTPEAAGYDTILVKADAEYLVAGDILLANAIMK